MTFNEAVQSAFFQKYMTFSGRASRSEYWKFSIVVAVGALAALFMDGALGTTFTVEGGMSLGYAYVLFGLVVTLPGVAAAIRRLHDTGRSGWFFLVSAIPLLGSFILLYFLIQKGSAGPNQFGPDPLNPLAPATSPYSPPLQSPPHTPSTAQNFEHLALLEKLGSLRDQGLLSSAEFEAQKAAILRNR